MADTWYRGINVIEVTLNKNIVTCRHAAWPVLHPMVDLTEDPIAARRAVYAAERFFLLSSDVVYSGFARKTDVYDGEPGPAGPCFYVQLWHNARLYRTVAFRDFGYVGVLHVEIKSEDVKESIDRDLIGSFIQSLDGFQGISPDEACATLALVYDNKLQISIPYATE